LSIPLDRAYSLLEVKTVEPSRRTISGLASTPELDRQGDIFDPAGATFKNPIPLLLHHDATHPIGTAYLTATAAGITFEATFPTVDEAGPLKARIDDAWQCLKAGVISGASIGYRVLDGGVQYLKSGARKLVKTEICELSLVTIPANANATIRLVKSLAASRRTEPPMKQTSTEHIQALENKRAALAARMTEIMETAAGESQTLEADQATEHDGLTLQVKSIDADLGRWREMERMQITTAQPVPSAPSARPSSLPRISVKANVAPGTAFIRYAQAMACADGSLMHAAEYAKRWADSTPEVELALKAAVAAGTTTDATWAGPLVQIQPLANEFIEMLRPATVIGRIPGINKVPFNVSIPAQNSGGTYGWVGQGAPKPVGKLTFGTVTLGVTKCAGIIVITEELARTSSPSAEAVIRRDMINGIAYFLDQEFTDPAKAPVTNVSPGSITNGVTPITSAGTSGANARTDVQAMLSAMSAANISARGAVLLMSEANALALAGALNPLGNPLFPTLDAQGGTVRGITVITSQVLGANNILLAPDCIIMADDGGVTIDVSREASLQMDSAPMAAPDATVVMTSLWQMNLVGLRAERFINWKRARTGCVQIVVQTYVG